MRISTGDLARAFDVTDEAIRFYEKKGLLHPIREEGKKYRIFDRVDIQKVINIKRMQAQNYSLDEISSMYTCTSLPDLLILQKNKIQLKKQSLMYHTRILERMQEIENKLQQSEQLLLKPQIVHLKNAYLKMYPSIPQLWAEIKTDSTMRQLFLHQPLTSISTILQIHADYTFDVQKGAVIFSPDIHMLQLNKKEFVKVPLSCAVQMMFKIKNGHFDHQTHVDILKQFMLNNGITPCSYAFTYKLIDFKDEHKDVIHYAEIICPCK